MKYDIYQDKRECPFKGTIWSMPLRPNKELMSSIDKGTYGHTNLGTVCNCPYCGSPILYIEDYKNQVKLGNHLILRYTGD